MKSILTQRQKGNQLRHFRMHSELSVMKLNMRALLDMASIHYQSPDRGAEKFSAWCQTPHAVIALYVTHTVKLGQFHCICIIFFSDSGHASFNLKMSALINKQIGWNEPHLSSSTRQFLIIYLFHCFSQDTIWERAQLPQVCWSIKSDVFN